MRLIKFSLLALLICCIVLTAVYAMQQKRYSKNLHIQKILSTIPQEDYAALEKLFRDLVFENYFAYTLFGSKPMTYYGAFYEQPPYITTDNPNTALAFLTHWKVWEKYANLPEFQSENFIFIEERRPELFGVLFLNQKNVRSCVQENIETFKNILGEETTPEKVLESLISSQDVYTSLKDSHILYGILFGFGAENAMAFHQKFDLGLPLPDPAPFHDEDPDSHILPLPYFSVFYPNKDIEKLRRQYQQEREQILKIYSKGEFLEITLTQLLSGN